MAEELLEMLERVRRRLLREVDRVISEITMERSDIGPDGSLRPLYVVYEYPDHYTVYVDLPAADTSTLNIVVTGDHLVIEAKLEREISLSDLYGGTIGREVRVSFYRHILPLPPDADPSGVRYEVKPGKRVEIVIPKRGGG